MNQVKLLPGFSLVSEIRMSALIAVLDEKKEPFLKSTLAYQNTPYDFMRLPFDEDTITAVAQQVQKFNAYKPALIVVVGIGGSSMGTAAVYQALGGMYVAQECTVPLIFADSVDIDATIALTKMLKKHLERKEVVLCVMISKSGTTTETIVNGTVILDLLRFYAPAHYRDWVIVITDKNSALWHFADKEKFTLFEIPKKVGGRFSLFSAVGLVPLALSGFDIKLLCAGACQAVTDFESNASLITQSAAFMYAHYTDYHLLIHDTFIFSLQLENFGKWYRQLIGESLAKERIIDKKPVGIVPTVSLGTLDLHSVGQLYLGGPLLMSTMFVTVGGYGMLIPEYETLKMCGSDLQGKNVSSIVKAIIGGVQHAYSAKKRPFMSLHIEHLSEKTVGFIMQMKMIEVCCIADLLDVNAFDQPNVEDYKKQTRRILARE